MKKQDNDKVDNPQESIADLELSSDQAKATKAGGETTKTKPDPPPFTWTYTLTNTGNTPI